MKRPKSLREALAAKRTHVVTVNLSVVEQTLLEERQAALRDARQRLSLSEFSGSDKATVDRLQAAVVTAKADLDECLWTIRLRGLTSDADYDALITEHTRDDKTIDLDGLHCALLAACALDSDMSADDWQAELWSGRWSRAERSELFDSVRAANATTGSGIPNG